MILVPFGLARFVNWSVGANLARKSTRLLMTSQIYFQPINLMYLALMFPWLDR